MVQIAKQRAAGTYCHRFNRCIAVAILSVTVLNVHGSSAEEAQLFVLQADGTKLRPLTFEPETSYRSPNWSSDGKWLAYERHRLINGQRQGHICLSNSDGTEVRDIGPGELPCWSPDNQHIAFASVVDGQPTTDVAIMTTDGRNRTLLASAATNPRWSPDGQHLALIDFQVKNISLLDVVTMERQSCLPDGWQPDRGLSWSKDGRRVCFRLPGYRDEPSSLVLCDIRERVPQVLLRGNFGISTAWSSDGQSILVSLRKNEASPYQMMLVPVDGSRPPTAVPGQPVDRHNTDLDWSADGAQIVFSSQALQSGPTK
ncbi:MAG: hypothetical protein O2931_03310 [Planctomycetota bacterium]|nr:hypothetical protein [Planctomycetota bacterium]MDA1177805.1 hypothetical protein [Planctomycetota bacterium]